YQDKDFWGTADNARHGKKPQRDFDHYLKHNMLFDTAGFFGAPGAIKGGLIEIPAAPLFFSTPYSQGKPETRAVRQFVTELRTLGEDGEAILSGNPDKLLKQPAKAA